MLHHFFADTLQQAGSRIAPTQQTVKFHLDKNEQSADVDAAFKHRVLERLMNTDWNRYPSADQRDIEVKVAEYCGLLPENIVLSAGSASIITTLLNHFALNNKHIVIAQPSYSLFDYHCKTNNIGYEPWMLNADLEYDLQTLPKLGANSVLLITSPNNPAGCSLGLESLEAILSEHSESLVILDGVYTEFGEADPTPLVKKYPNLIVLRSFSKAFPIAGLRLGYLCAAPKTAAIVKKLILQFSINHFSLVFAREMLNDQSFMEGARKKVRAIVAERERMRHLIGRRFAPGVLQIFPSEGNFLLIRVLDDAAFAKLMEDLAQCGIKVLDTSNAPLLRNTFRVSIGTAYENEVFFAQLTASLQPKTAPVFQLRTLNLPKTVQMPLGSLMARVG